MKLLRTIVCASLLVTALCGLALAQPKTADEWYKEGANQYNLGDFDKAVEAFKHGFELETDDAKKPSYLYNIAQAYRQAHKCKDTGFFYKRYLSLKDQDTAKPLPADKRAEIEGWIAEAEKCEAAEESLAHKPPDSTLPVDTTKPPTTTPPTTTKPPVTTAKVDTGTGSGDDDDTGNRVTKTATTQPQLFVARFTGGVAKIKAGDLTVPIQATFSLFAGYPIALNDQLELDVGVDATYTSVPFTNIMTSQNSNAAFIAALADAGLTYTVAPSVGLRADVGAGVLAFTGLDAGNPFTMNGAATTGALGMVAVRGAIAADYAFTPNLVGTITPIAFTYSPAKTGLSEDIKSITRFDFMLGIGYRM